MAIELGTLEIEFIPLEIEFVTLEIEFVTLEIEFVTLAIEFGLVEFAENRNVTGTESGNENNLRKKPNKGNHAIYKCWI